VQLTDAAQKERVIGALGADVLAMLGFTTELSQVPAGQFLVNILDHVNLAEIWVGADFAFGHDREGTVDFLIRSGATSGFAVHVLPRERLNGTPISSSLVRDLVKAGDVAGAAILLGHYFSVTGRVVSGHGRGLQLGFPTANVDPAAHQMLPAVGIYAAYLRYDEMRLPAAVSVGYNVVFGGESISVEAYILAFDGDLRGREVALDFVARIRDEQDFDSSDALIAEMRRDVEKVEEIVARADEPGELILLP
jgi:riboflavin kinase/FMN adenylyltransferase